MNVSTIFLSSAILVGLNALLQADESSRDESNSVRHDTDSELGIDLSADSPIQSLFTDACMQCHDADTDSNLNFELLEGDFASDGTAVWEKVFDRIASGEMPPKSEPTPPDELLKPALIELSETLTRASRQRIESIGRVSARRLTKTELEFTLQDLFQIPPGSAASIPDEIESGTFDTVGELQRISAVHLESYAQAADQALDQAIQLGQQPYRDYGDFADSNFEHLEQWHKKPISQGGSITRKLKYGKGVVLFRDIDYLTQFTYGVPMDGIYRLRARIAAYQSDDPLIGKIIVKDGTGGARVGVSVDLYPRQPKQIDLDIFLRKNEAPYLTFVDPRQATGGVFSVGGAQNYNGPGLAILSQSIQGPIHSSWPSPATSALLGKAVRKNANRAQFELPKNPQHHAESILAEWGQRIFRRPVSQEELQRFIELLPADMGSKEEFLNGLRIPLKAMLSSPQFLFFDETVGELNSFALASRLSYFLWKSLPDAELWELAARGELSDPTILASQVDRLLDDSKSRRFVDDFVGQWLRLHHVNVTLPDDGLYPEYDELLGAAIPKETQLFIADLFARDLPIRNLIDSDYTFVNRRLAEHYGIQDVQGQEFRRVDLPASSPRGGILTQAAILKTTANGTTTSPVMRGNFVLTSILGTPPSPPPPDVGSIEPDTRGATTIREILDKHRNMDTCSQCHRHIDPPGFALESFDPIGGYREYYRATGGSQTFGDFTVKLPPKQGLKVDPSGVTSQGEAFTTIHEFKELLLDQEDQIARNFVMQLVTYATGAPIQFADRSELDQILSEHKESGYRVRSLLHAIVRSRIFLRK